MALTLSSDAFKNGGDIPSRFTCDGAGTAPALSWSGAPEGTKSFVLIVDDPDAPSGTFVHWVVVDLPASTTSLAEGGTLPAGARTGKNDFGKVGYGGPCPPSGTHRYFFKLYALDTALGLNPGATKADLLAAMQGHVLAEGQLMGRYGRE